LDAQESADEAIRLIGLAGLAKLDDALPLVADQGLPAD
jgi:hypothetical protein